MCLFFFEGKGYDDGFTRHMAEIKNSLQKNPLIRLTAGTDVICQSCPHSRGGRCDSEEKVLRYDRLVLELCGLEIGRTVEYRAFDALVRDRILNAGRRKEICADCQWDSICSLPQSAAGV